MIMDQLDMASKGTFYNFIIFISNVLAWLKYFEVHISRLPENPLNFVSLKGYLHTVCVVAFNEYNYIIAIKLSLFLHVVNHKIRFIYYNIVATYSSEKIFISLS